MRQSGLFTKVARQFPKGEVAANARFLERAGFIYKNSAGIYSFLPLGWLTLQKIFGIIREEMNTIGAQEILMQALVEKKYLDATKRWGVEVGYKVSADDKEEDLRFVLGWTHEEVITEIATKYISSYRDLPKALYQIQAKFRKEPRAKSGLLRGREFFMKDLYSFHSSDEDFKGYYQTVAGAYRRIFERCGLKSVYTLAAGGDFTANYTNEFQVIAEAGEDTIYICEKCEYAENREISALREGSKCPKCGGRITAKKSIEVGNIFPLGTRYSEALNLRFLDQEGRKKPVVMGSYGIGPSRLLATIVEIHHDQKGIIWPKSAAPFPAHLLELNGASAKDLYEDLQKTGIEVLYDDRSLSAGEKLVESDLIGLPVRLVVSPQTGRKVEMRKRDSDKAEIIDREEAKKLLRNLDNAS